MRDHLGQFILGSEMNFAKGIKILDDCEGTCNWIKYAVDANATVSYETAAAWTGTKGLQVYAGDATPEAGDVCIAQKNFGYSETGKLVIRAKMASPIVTRVGYMGFFLSIFDGSHEYTVSLNYSPTNGSVYYSSSNGSFVEITELLNLIQNNTYIEIELVLNLITHTYISVTINGLTKDLSGISYYQAGASTDRYMNIGFRVTNTGVNPATAYYDNIYVGEFENV